VKERLIENRPDLAAMGETEPPPQFSLSRPIYIVAGLRRPQSRRQLAGGQLGLGP
jgi:hypothetical protein